MTTHKWSGKQREQKVEGGSLILLFCKSPDIISLKRRIADALKIDDASISDDECSSTHQIESVYVVTFDESTEQEEEEEVE